MFSNQSKLKIICSLISLFAIPSMLLGGIGNSWVRAAEMSPNSPTYTESYVGFVDVLSVDATLFPKIWAYVTVDTDAGNSGSLTQSNFTVYEDGVLQTIQSFEFASGATAATEADILFVFDDTGSMGDEIGTMKTKCQGITDAIEAAGIDARYALVSFGDVPEVDQGWTSDAAVFKAAIDALYASGGDDEPEDNLDAIEMGLGLGFRAEAQKIVIDITDAHTHYRGDGTEYAEYTIPEVADDLIGLGVALFVVSSDFGTPPSPDSDKRTLADNVGGVWMDIHGAADFGEILDSIVGTITTAYHIDYTTTNPTQDGTNRTIKIVVNDPVQGTDDDTGMYKAPSGAVAGRSIAPDSIPAGGTTTISVTIIANQTLSGFALDEEPPEGWTVAQVDNAGAAIFEPTEARWIWIVALQPGQSKTVIYQLTAPPDATEGTYNISGVVMSAGVEDIEVGGENTITVTEEAGPWSYDKNGNGYIEIGELLCAIRDYIGGDITIGNLLNVISLYISHTHR